MPRKIHLIIIILFSISLALPFINKPIHIDEWDSLVMSKCLHSTSISNLLKIKVGYMGGEFNAYQFTHTPLLLTIIPIFVSLNGNPKMWKLHIFYIFFILLSSLSAYFIGKRYLRDPLSTALLLISTPAFLIISQSIITDLPALAFFLASLALYLHGSENNKPMFFWIAGFCATLSWLFTYQSLFLIPFVFLDSILRKKSIKNAMYFVIVPLACVILWSLFNIRVYGTPHVLISFYQQNIDFLTTFKNIPLKIVGILSNLGGSGIIPLFVLFWAFKYTKDSRLFIITFLASAIIFRVFLKNYSLMDISQVSLYFSIGLYFTYLMVKKFNEYRFLSLWYLGFLGSSILFLPYGSSKYILPLLLPPIILFVKEIELKLTDKKYSNVFLFLCVFFTLLLSLSVAWADYQFAKLYENFTGNIGQKYSQRNICFTGEWGFRYYMEEKGYKYLLTNDNSPRPGDIIVIPGIPCPSPLHPDLQARLKQIDTITYESKFPIRVMNDETHAGFYSDGWGLLPYSFSTVPLETFKIYQVER